ncbi:5'-nucleotidase C-terminal domain-containing protein [Ferruginibacter lapsinanis]|uniref:5'-nucleotidase C-terminal domain-containing protein n=1 Tax=Ferruginibacter lapsinanis TaxID=563172 RepID=UPI001E3AD50A|nr:5'-nucleotidase C-terminal domain-containing protein [Ferruginibacter lapsinanis]UEG50261.1 5'-nucleotidase C-terminal domain-containing protein [Ferruginibacter lapsinanis]
MRTIFYSFYLFAIAALFTACDPVYQAQTVQYKDYRIKQEAKPSNELSTLLKPYSDNVNAKMNDLIAVAGMTLEKKSPEGTLNNVLTDAMLQMAKEKYQMPVDAAFLNYGAIRLPIVSQGNITRGKVYEIAPFDNILVLQQLTGAVLQQVLDNAASRGGWPCAGMSYQIKDKKAINIKIGGVALNESTTYTIALVDYIANGGDDCEMLKTIPQMNNGYLYRDAVMEYFARLNSQGKQIISKLENRVSNAE